MIERPCFRSFHLHLVVHRLSAICVDGECADGDGGGGGGDHVG